MKAMSKQQLANSAGVTTKTLMSWCEPFSKELETMGMQPHMKVLPPHIVRFITEKFCIDVGEWGRLDFNVKRGAMAAYLTDGREVIVPVSMFPDIKRLSRKQREDWMIMDNQYFSFETLSRIYSVKDLLRIWSES